MIWLILSECKSVIPVAPESFSSSSTEPTGTIYHGMPYKFNGSSRNDMPQGKSYLLHVVGDPERNRRSPVSVPRDIPVAGIGKPVTEPPVSDTLGDPIE